VEDQQAKESDGYQYHLVEERERHSEYERKNAVKNGVDWPNCCKKNRCKKEHEYT